VLGVEGDYDGASINGSQQGAFPSILAPSGNTNGLMVHENINSLATVRGRIGHTWGPGLLYFTKRRGNSAFFYLNRISC
jgi:hypothetical protein